MNSILSVAGLTKRYGGSAGVEGVSFALAPGRITAGLGHNGAGKTTTIRSILGLLRLDAGSVLYQGAVYDTQSPAYDRVRADFGVCLDHPGFYPDMSGMRNLELFAGLYGLCGRDFQSRAEDLLGRLELLGARHDPVKTYSKGMAQKLALARAVLHQPKVLFLDEPMSGLDPAARLLMRGFLKELAVGRGTSILLTSHDLGEVEQLADEVFILEKGRLILSGELEALKRAHGAPRHVVTFDSIVDEAAARLYAQALCASAVRRQACELDIETDQSLDIERALKAGAGLGLKVVGFRERAANLEQIYFDSLHRHENRN